jgi:diguanylate cyclase (GGDEF)-like protein
MTFSWGGATVTLWLDDIGEFVAAFLAAGTCWLAAARHRSRSRIAWRLIAASAFAWGAGEVAWSYLELLGGQAVPFPSLADFGFLAAVPLAVVGILAFPAAPDRTSPLIRTILDGLILAGSLFLVSWATVLGAVFRTSGGDIIAQLIAIAYPAGDVLIGTVALTLARRAPREQRLPFLLLAGGMVANLLADSGFAYLTAVNQYGSGNTIDTGWVAGYALIMLAALRAGSRPPVLAEAEATPGPAAQLLPYLPLAGAMGVCALQQIGADGLDPVVFWCLLVTVTIVLVRQMLLLGENGALITRLESMSANLAYQAFHDSLTDLANRAAFRSELDRVLQASRNREPVAVLALDLDNFKAVNDTYGHGVGDEVLKQVGHRLLHTVRPGDVVARLGGDEFGVVLGNMQDPQLAPRVAERIVSELRRPFYIGGRAIPIDASVGFASSTGPEVEMDALLRDADQAMYRAKTEAKARLRRPDWGTSA